ncbi:MAG: hypothetical protein CMJ31_02435, partial [Phycisphaerae bacterium]|nr:hypothetical protein [Phycisphaerae bacterium]
EQTRDRVLQAFAVSGEAAPPELRERFESAFEAWRAESTAVAEAATSGDISAVRTADAVASRGDRFNAMRDLIDQVSERLEVEAEAGIARIQQAKDDAATEAVAMERRADTRLFGLLTLGGLTVAGVMGVLVPLALLIARRLGAMARAMESVASGKADLTLRVNDTRKDEVALLGQWFDAIVERFERVVIDVQAAVIAVEQNSTAIASRAGEVNQRIQLQSTGAVQTSSAVTELAASVDEVAARCQDVASTAERSRELSSDGGAVVRDTVTSMNSIAETFSVAGRSMDELSTSVDRIGSIIGVIDEIAEQTNLLALNAAIEAARAGEHGRGFAVVADEVRKLADRTTQATSEVSESIRSIQTETGDAVSKMTAGVEQVGAGSEKAARAGASLTEIEAAIREVAAMVTSIAATTTEQAQATGEINRQTEEIAGASNAISESMSMTVRDIEGVRNASNSLSALVAEYRTSATM